MEEAKTNVSRGQLTFLNDASDHSDGLNCPLRAAREIYP
jgi:hypothetical protein